MKAIQKYVIKGEFLLENGKSIIDTEIAYQTWGKLNSRKDNAILVCHALTGNSGVADYYDENGKLVEGWWRHLIGEGQIIDTNKYFVIGTNVLGSCYGSSGPTTINPVTSEQYRLDFPLVTIRDMVKAQKSLIDSLEIEKLHTVIGGSLGGMQALEWGVTFPDSVERLITIAASARHSAWAIGLNEIARKAITNDPVWNNGNYHEQPEKGLALARMGAMLSYRSSESVEKRFGRERKNDDYKIDSSDNFQVESYLHYQGKKLVERFDANSYLYLTKALDTHDISRKRGTLPEVLGQIKAKTLVIGVSSDLLYPVNEQKELSLFISDSIFKEIESIHGHDGFLIEQDQLSGFIEKFYQNIEVKDYCY